MKHFVGIDIGGTSSTIGLVNSNGTVLDRKVIMTNDYKGQPIKTFLDHLINIIRQFDDDLDEKISCVGIGAPNGNYLKGTIELAPNLPWKEVHDVTTYMKAELGLPVVLTNDANAAALGEKQFGVAGDLDDFIMITLGTGLGSGIISGGQLIYGHDGFAGEIGHALVMPGGRPCTCGRNGCLEAYVSSRGIVQTYEEISGIEAENVAVIGKLAREGDEQAIQAFTQTGIWLGIKLADAAAYTSPAAFVFFGGIAQASEYFLPTVRETMENNLHNIYRGKIKLLMSGLSKNDAAILGSAALAQTACV